jgi:hypothetical protein
MNMAKCHNLKQSHEMPQILKLQMAFGQKFKGVFLGQLKHAPSLQCVANLFWPNVIWQNEYWPNVTT